MGMTIGNNIFAEQKITCWSADGTATGSRAVKKSCSASKTGNDASKKRKKLPYNFKEISAKLLQTQTSGNAGRVMMLARSRSALLRQKLASGEYDSGELASAIQHADAMVRAAKKRMKNLKTEEMAKQHEESPIEEFEKREEEQGVIVFLDEDNIGDGEKCGMVEELSGEPLQQISQELSQELARELQRIMEETIEETMRETAKSMQASFNLDEMTEDLAIAMDEMKPEDLEQLKKKHRSEELREIMEADMKYLKAMFDRLAKEKQSIANGVAGGGGASPESYVSDAPVPGQAATVTPELVSAEISMPATVTMGDGVGGRVDISI